MNPKELSKRIEKDLIKVEERTIKELFEIVEGDLMINSAQYNILKQQIVMYDGDNKKLYREKLNKLVGKVRW